MEINIRGDKIVVTDAIKEQIKSKISRLDKYFDNPKIIKANVIIKVHNLSQIIEVTIPTKRYTLRREEKDLDLYTAIDLVVDKLERQIRKNKTKLNNRLKNTDHEFNFDYILAKEEETNSKIVKRKNLETKPMDEEEAILEAELLGHDFFVFKNIDEDCVSVIYKRKDNSYGIINVR